MKPAPQPRWEAEGIDPKSRLAVERALGKRDEALIERVVRGAAARVSHPQGVVFFSDGEPTYETLFPKAFGTSYQPARNGGRGRQPGLRYRIGRRQAHVRIIKKRYGKQLVEVSVQLAHGSNKRLERELQRLGYNQPSTSAIERRNGTAMTIYNWGRANRSLRKLLPEPQGRKQYEQWSPAMAAGLTGFLWSVEAILRYRPFPPRP